MSFEWLDEITKQVTRYSSFTGQAWYILTFIFRLIVVASLGGAVYDDEQDNFECNTKSAGCHNACYNQFTRISQIKFWAFQLIAVAAPVIFFHAAATYLSGEQEKIKHTEQQIAEDHESLQDEHYRSREVAKMRHRKKIVGKMKTKRVFEDDEIKEIPINNKIRFAYYITVVLRIIAEGVFLYLTYTLYNYPIRQPECSVDYVASHNITGNCFKNRTGLSFIWAEFPYFYRCSGTAALRSAVSIACFENVVFGGYVPCWPSRPWEKTIFMRYMNVMSAICFCLCALEVFEVPLRYYKHTQNKKRADFAYYDTYPQRSYYPGLAKSPPNAVYSMRRKHYENGPQGYVEDRPRPEASLERYQARMTK